MLTESLFFYFLLLTILITIINALLVRWHQRH